MWSTFTSSTGKLDFCRVVNIYCTMHIRLPWSIKGLIKVLNTKIQQKNSCETFSWMLNLEDFLRHRWNSPSAASFLLWNFTPCCTEVFRSIWEDLTALWLQHFTADDKVCFASNYILSLCLPHKYLYGAYT